MISLSIIFAGTVIADAYMQVHGYKSWFWTWDKKEDEQQERGEQGRGGEHGEATGFDGGCHRQRNPGREGEQTRTQSNSGSPLFFCQQRHGKDGPANGSDPIEPLHGNKERSTVENYLVRAGHAVHESEHKGDPGQQADHDDLGLHSADMEQQQEIGDQIGHKDDQKERTADGEH